MVRFLKFAFIGGAATLLQFLLLGIFVEFLGMIPTVASATSYCCSAIFNYLANYYLTFSGSSSSSSSSSSSHRQTLPKFVVTVALGMALSTALFSIFHYILVNYVLANTFLIDRAYLIAQLFATLLTLIVNFLMHKFWIYRK